MPLTSQDIQRYAGKYVNSEILELVAREGRLFYKANDAEFPVRKVGERSLQVGEPGAGRSLNLDLKFGASGRAEYLYYRMVAHKRMSSD